MMEAALQTFFLAIVAIDPISLAPIFVALTTGISRSEQYRIALLAIFISAAIVIIFFFGGNHILNTLGVSLDSFRIIGGLFLIVIAFEMVFNQRSARREDNAVAIRDDTAVSNLAVFPISVPLIAGPATITLAILEAGKSVQSWTYAIVTGLLPLLSVIALCAISMIISGAFVTYIGNIIPMIFQRVFGLLLGAIAIELVIGGMKTVFEMH